MLSGLILAGGRSSRMGRDKSGVVLPDGRTLLQRQAQVLRDAGAETMFASVRPGATGLPAGVTAVFDAVEDAGPLAGIAAGLGATRTGRVIVLAVDMPEIGAEHLRKLIALSSETCGVVPALNGQIEPLVAVYPRALAASAELALTGIDRAVHAWVRSEAEQGHLFLWNAPPDWAGALRSWNTPGDLPE